MAAAPYQPFKEEEIITVRITKREAILVQKMRKYVFGKIIVSKANGLIVRMEVTDSHLIDESIKIEI